MSRHHGGPVEGTSQTPRTPQQHGTEGFKGGPQFQSEVWLKISVRFFFSSALNFFFRLLKRDHENKSIDAIKACIAHYSQGYLIFI